MESHRVTIELQPHNVAGFATRAMLDSVNKWLGSHSGHHVREDARKCAHQSMDQVKADHLLKDCHGLRHRARALPVEKRKGMQSEACPGFQDRPEGHNGMLWLCRVKSGAETHQRTDKVEVCGPPRFADDRTRNFPP